MKKKLLFALRDTFYFLWGFNVARIGYGIADSGDAIFLQEIYTPTFTFISISVLTFAFSFLLSLFTSPKQNKQNTKSDKDWYIQDTAECFCQTSDPCDDNFTKSN